MGPWLSDTQQDAWRSLLRMTAQLDAHLNRALQDTSGLSKADYDVLVPLSEAPGERLRVYELSGALSWEQSRLSHHLARMQRRGLIEREECLSDRRGAFVRLTAAGRCAIDKAAPAHVATVRSVFFDGLSAEQVGTLAEVTRSVLTRLDTSPPPSPPNDAERAAPGREHP